MIEKTSNNLESSDEKCINRASGSDSQHGRSPKISVTYKKMPR